MTAVRKIVLTSGDRKGIGLEVSLKALATAQIPANTQIVLVAGSDRKSKVHWGRFATRNGASVLGVDDWKYLTANELNDTAVVILPSKLSAAEWFDRAVSRALDQSISGIITGPISKESFRTLTKSKPPMGHTGLLAQRTRRTVFQGYVGSELNVVLATDHIPLRAVEAALTRSKVDAALDASNSLRATLPGPIAKRPMAILGLNPHAGEFGAIGSFELNLKRWVLNWSARNRVRVVGPLSPDAAFSADSRKKHSVFLALYHDQGLIPFKMLHGQETGFQVSLGLPFVRTSVDHGTAVDIVGKDKANPGSMSAALHGAIQLSRQKRSDSR